MSISVGKTGSLSRVNTEETNGPREWSLLWPVYLTDGLQLNQLWCFIRMSEVSEVSHATVWWFCHLHPHSHTHLFFHLGWICDGEGGILPETCHVVMCDSWKTRRYTIELIYIYKNFIYIKFKFKLVCAPTRKQNLAERWDDFIFICILLSRESYFSQDLHDNGWRVF